MQNHSTEIAKNPVQFFAKMHCTVVAKIHCPVIAIQIMP
jgi:hypothetical protein